MSVPLFQIDAFASGPFTGNPAAVCFPSREVSDAWLQRVANEMNLSETAFLWPRGDSQFDLRWLTPTLEVDLCGHATLASAHAIWESARAPRETPLVFHTRSGQLGAKICDRMIELDFPSAQPVPIDTPTGLLEALGIADAEVLLSPFDYVVVIEGADRIRALNPDFRALRALPVRGITVTAKSDGEHDFVSRFFAPGSGIDEDPVTGSAHCTLAPLWSARLGKSVMRAHQASARGGELEVEVRGDRTLLRGCAVTILRGELLA